ncbi:unnamed protein product [Rotaria socialis]|uniref:Uncharacterized protein n=4 Tax=Rotaria socialis TaxID=392032 RepID=A0A821BL59_9BILA|nr:unnamed protein product [Rotaria socialis]CAF4593903.1 unnamed protein product [Rotaria socialis]
MPIRNPTHKTPWRYRRFWRLFRRKKPSLIDITYPYEYMMRFPRLPITVPPLVPTLMSYRWNDEDDCEALPKKPIRDNHSQQHARRRLPKRYSDLVGPLSNKIYLPRKDSLPRETQLRDTSSQHDHQPPTTKGKSGESFCAINSHSKRAAEILSTISKNERKEHSFVTRRYSSKNKQLSTTNAVDLLAHRMQAAMSAELMHSLDRNFVFSDRKQLSNFTNINRSQSLHISKAPMHNRKDKSHDNEPYYHVIPRVKYRPDDEQKSIETMSSVDELTPDYDDDDIIIRPFETNSNDEIGEEPAIDYDDSKSIEIAETEEKPTILPTDYDLGVTSPFIVQQISTTSSSTGTYAHPQSSVPPTPPPLPNTITQPKKTAIRCRTIADQITADHKLILKDERETLPNIYKEKLSVVPVTEEHHPKRSSPIQNIPPKPCYIHLSKEILEKPNLRKVAQPVSRSYSTYGSMSLLNDHDTELTTMREKSSTLIEQPFDGLSSSATTSIIIENEYEHRASSKIYNDYKRRASSITYATNNTLTSTYSHSAIIHPMHTHIGLRSSTTTTSSSNDKLNENVLANKKMNLCVINQLNEHLSTRFRQQHQQDICVAKTNKTISENPIEHENYDRPPALGSLVNDVQVNVYDEPQNMETTSTTPIERLDMFSGSIPPPPPPLPVGGFRPVLSQLNRPSSSQRTSVLTLPRESNSADLRCSTGTSTTSSKLSDARILRELRTNPLFTKAQQHLEIEPDLNGRPVNGSSCYLRLDTCSKGTSSTTVQNDSMNDNVETFIMRPSELKAVINNTATSANSNPKETNRFNSRVLTNSCLQTQRRQSELELIFRVREYKRKRDHLPVY